MAEQIGAMYVTIDGKDQISPLLKKIEGELTKVNKATGEVKIGNNKNFEYARQQFADLSKYYARLQDQMNARVALKLDTGDVEREMNTVMNSVRKLYDLVSTPVNGTKFIDRQFESTKANAKSGTKAVEGVKDIIDSYTRTVLGSARATAGLQQEIDRLGTKNGKALTANSAKEEANLVSKNRLIEGLTVAYNRLGYAMQDVGRKMSGAQGNDFLMNSGNGLLKRIEMYRDAIGVALEGAQKGVYKRSDAVQLLGSSYIDLYDKRSQFGKSVGLYQKDQKQAERMTESYAKAKVEIGKIVTSIEKEIGRLDKALGFKGLNLTDGANLRTQKKELQDLIDKWEKLGNSKSKATDRTTVANMQALSNETRKQAMAVYDTAKAHDDTAKAREKEAQRVAKETQSLAVAKAAMNDYINKVTALKTALEGIQSNRTLSTGMASNVQSEIGYLDALIRKLEQFRDAQNTVIVNGKRVTTYDVLDKAKYADMRTEYRDYMRNAGQTRGDAIHDANKTEKQVGDLQAAYAKYENIKKNIDAKINELNGKISEASLSNKYIDVTGLKNAVAELGNVKRLYEQLGSDASLALSKAANIQVQGELNAAMKGAKAAIQDTNKELRQAKTDAKEAEAAQRSLNRTLGNAEVAAQRAATQMARYQQKGLDVTPIKLVKEELDKLQRTIAATGATKANATAVSEEYRRLSAQLRIVLEQMKQLDIANKQTGDSLGHVGKNAEKVNSTLAGLKQSFMQFATFYGFRSIANDIVQLGGKIEQQHIAMQTILGDFQQANVMFEQMKELALESPFKFSDINQSARQLAAYGVEANNLYETTKRLSDISSGVGVDMSRIALAYGQVKARSWLDGKELRQFAYAGIPLLEELSKFYTQQNGAPVSTGDVRKMVTNREVSFEDVKKVLFEMTEAGGQFYNMQLKLSQTLLGRWNKMKDAWEIMMSDMASGDSMIGAMFKGALDLVTAILLNVNKILPTIVAIGSFAGFKKIGAIFTNVLIPGFERMGTRMQAIDRLTKMQAVQWGIINSQQAASNANLTKMQRLQMAGMKFYNLIGGIPGALALGMGVVFGIIQKASEKAKEIKEYYQNFSSTGGQRAKEANEILTSSQGIDGSDYDKMKSSINQMRDFLKLHTKRYGMIVHETNALEDEYEVWKKLREEVEAVEAANKGASEMSMSTVKNLKGILDGSDIKDFNDDNPENGNLANLNARAIADAEDALARLAGKYKETKDAIYAPDGRMLPLADALNNLSDPKYKKALTDLQKELNKWHNGTMGQQIVGFVQSNLVAQEKFEKEFSEPLKKVAEKMRSEIKTNWQKYELRKEDVIKENDRFKKVLHDLIMKQMESFDEYGGRFAEYAKGKVFEIAFNYKMKANNVTEEEKATPVNNRMKEILDRRKLTAQQAGKLFPKYAKFLEQNATASSENEFVDAYKKEVQKRIDHYKAIEKRPSATAAEKKAAKDDYERWLKAYEFDTGQKFEDKHNKKTRGNQRDTELQGWQKRIQAIERFLKLYKEYRDLYGEIAARERIGKDIEGLDLEKELGITAADFGDPVKVRKAIADMMEKLYKAKGSDERKAARDTAAEKEKEESLNREKEVIQLRMKAYEDDARLEKERWDRFQEMRKAGLSDSVASSMTLNLDKAMEDKYFKWIKMQPKAFIEGEGNLVDVNKLKAEQYDLEEELKDAKLRLLDVGLDGATVHKLERRVDELTKAIAEKAKEISNAELGVGGATMLEDAAATGTARKKVLTTNWVEIVRQRLESAIAKTGKDYSVESLLDAMSKNPDKVKNDLGDKNGENYEVYEFVEAYKAAVKDEEKRQDEAVKKLMSALKSFDKTANRIETEGKIIKEDLGKMKDESSGIEGFSYGDIADADTQLKLMRASVDYWRLMEAPLTVVNEKAKALAESFKKTLKKALDAGVISVKEYADEIAKIDGKTREARKKSEGDRGERGMAFMEEVTHLGDRKGYLQAVKSRLEQEAAALAEKGDQAGADKKFADANKIGKNLRYIEDLESIVGGVGRMFKALTDVIGPVVDLFETLGMNEASDILKAGGNALSAASQVSGGLTALGLEKAGPYGAAVGAALSITNSILQQHDAALQKEIDASKARQRHDEWYMEQIRSIMQEQMGGVYGLRGGRDMLDRLTKMYTLEKPGILESVFDGKASLSNVTVAKIKEAQESGELYDAMMASVMAKRDEAMKQLNAERDKKNSDEDAIREYEEQLYDAEKEIKDLAKTVAEELYGIDFKQWSNDLGSALVNAWEQGLTGARAYKDAVSDILKNTMTSVIQQKYMQTALEPLMNDFMEQFDNDKGRLTDESWAILERLYQYGDEMAEATYAALDGLEQMAQRNGATLKHDASGMSASIAGVTENTADLLASYINAIRADVSVQRGTLSGIAADVARIADYVTADGGVMAAMAKGNPGEPDYTRSYGEAMARIADEQMPIVVNALASQIAELKRIETNTARGAVATEALQEMINGAVNGVRPINVRLQN